MKQGPNPHGDRLKSARQQGRSTHALFSGGALIYKIINARRRFAKKPGLRGADMLAAARKMLAARLRSVGTLKAGWWGALNILNRAVGKDLAFKKEHSMSRIKAPSTARVAQDGFNPSVAVEYNLQAKDEKYNRGIEKRVVETFYSAWGAETRSMKEYIEKKLAGDLKKADRSVPKSTGRELANSMARTMRRR
jgi:hypothetical protein